MTQAELAEYAQVTRLVVLRAEQGLYIQPPTAVLRALGAVDYSLIATITQDYRNWVRSERYANRYKFELAVGRLKADGSTFTEFRKRVHPSRAGFAKILVYPISLIEKFEENGSCAESLQIAFDEVGLGISLEDFDATD